MGDSFPGADTSEAVREALVIMAINPETIARYQPGGDIYATLLGQYGTDAANTIAAAAATGDNAAVNQALATVRSGPARNDSTLSLFWDQVTTDPLAAPLDSLNNQLGKAVWNVVKNPWVLLTAGLIVFHLFGGFTWLKKKLK